MLPVTKARYASLWFAVATNYAIKQPDYTEEEPSFTNQRTLDNIGNKSFDEIKNKHLKDYRKLNARVMLHLKGNRRSENLSADERWKCLQLGKLILGLKNGV